MDAMKNETQGSDQIIDISSCFQEILILAKEIESLNTSKEGHVVDC